MKNGNASHAKPPARRKLPWNETKETRSPCKEPGNRGTAQLPGRGVMVPLHVPLSCWPHGLTVEHPKSFWAMLEPKAYWLQALFKYGHFLFLSLKI